MLKIKHFIQQSWLLIVASCLFGLLIAGANATLDAKINKNEKAKNRILVVLVHRRAAEDAEGIFFYLAGRRQPGKNTSLRQNNWGFSAVRPVVFTESVSPDSVKERQLSVLRDSAVKTKSPFRVNP